VEPGDVTRVGTRDVPGVTCSEHGQALLHGVQRLAGWLSGEEEEEEEDLALRELGAAARLI